MNQRLRETVHYTQLAAGFGRSVLYRRGGVHVPVRAVVGQTLVQVETASEGVYIRHGERDYLVLASDLPLHPQAGDEIVDGPERFVVAAPDGEPVARNSGHGPAVIRIHTRSL